MKCHYLSVLSTMKAGGGRGRAVIGKGAVHVVQPVLG